MCEYVIDTEHNINIINIYNDKNNLQREREREIKYKKKHLNSL